MNENLSIAGARLFAQASRDYSSSAYAQGAYITNCCQTENFRPNELVKNLLRDGPRIQILLDTAIIFHQKYHVAKIPTKGDLIDVIKIDFNEAKRLMVLDGVALQLILSWYPQYAMKQFESEKLKKAAQKEYGQRINDLIETSRTKESY